MRHPTSADLAEAGEPVCNLQESILVQRGNVAGVIPAIAEHFGRLCRVAPGNPALHSGRARASVPAGPKGRPAYCLRYLSIDDAHANAGQWMANPAALDPDLVETLQRKSCVFSATAGEHSVQP